jgi:hypothetical protein
MSARAHSWIGGAVAIGSAAIACGAFGSADDPPAATVPAADAEASDVVEPDADAAAPCRYAEEIARDQPLHYFRFRPDAPARDEVTGADGADLGGVALASRGAVHCDPGDGALQLEAAAGDVVELLGDDYAFPGKVPFSVEVWVRPRSESGLTQVVGREIVVEQVRHGYSVVHDATEATRRFRFQRLNGVVGQGTPAMNDAPVPDGEARYVHLVGTFDGATHRLYLDGELASSTPYDLDVLPNDAGTLIGAREADGGMSRHFTGEVDEVAVYDRALPAARVRAPFAAAR